MELALARYRLLFKHPFGTAHGLRDGTDAVFVRLSRSGRHGYGEATLPPYLPFTQNSVIEEIRSLYLKCAPGSDPVTDPVMSVSLMALSGPARAALSTAYYDLTAKELHIPLVKRIGMEEDTGGSPGRCMVTIGHSTPEQIAPKLRELPDAPILKVKLGSIHDQDSLTIIKSLDNRPLFLDANQGWEHPDQALVAIDTAGRSRVIGLEQPFAKDRWDLHRELRRLTDVPVFGDESIQGLADLERAAGTFDGVNLKLMKCGGLDVALAMARKAHECGLRVMLGSMSESSLGCAAMACLAGLAEFVDLDGPWLVSNDPFEGLSLHDGQITVRPGAGIDIRQGIGSQLEWIPIGA